MTTSEAHKARDIMSSAADENAALGAVGPDGHLAEGTIGFAVTSAKQLGVGVELVHVVPTVVGAPTGTWGVRGGAQRHVSALHAKVVTGARVSQDLVPL